MDRHTIKAYPVEKLDKAAIKAAKAHRPQRTAMIDKRAAYRMPWTDLEYVLLGLVVCAVSVCVGLALAMFMGV